MSASDKVEVPELFVDVAVTLAHMARTYGDELLRDQAEMVLRVYELADLSLRPCPVCGTIAPETSREHRKHSTPITPTSLARAEASSTERREAPDRE